MSNIAFHPMPFVRQILVTEPAHDQITRLPPVIDQENGEPFEAKRPNQGLQRTALGARKIAAILNAGIGPSPFPIYDCAAGTPAVLGNPTVIAGVGVTHLRYPVRTA